ncbi:MAG: hypothetical protein NZ937_05085, partial [Armatimonadetes bacterium]|nr:hypothetical protein [Armatimonadota bacterium]
MRWVLAVALLCVSVSFALEPNLLTNGNFEAESDKDGVADGWFAEVHRNEGGEGYFAVDANLKVQGKFCQRIVHTSEKGWVRVSQDGIPAKPNSLYLFRCWMKANCRFLLIVYAFKADGSYETFVIAQGRGTGDEGRESEWRLFSGVVKTPADARAFKVSLVTDSKGEAWFDDAQLLLIERPIYAFVPIISVGTAYRLSDGLSDRLSEKISLGRLKPALTISLDGDLSEECWQHAEPLTPFLELGTGKVAEPSTVAKVLATQTHLLIAFHCDEPNLQGMRLKSPESGEPAYMDDCVEVYLDPQHTHSGFFQFVVTPKGNKWAQQVESAVWAKVWWLLPRPTQRLINKGWQAATKIGNDFWSAEI